MKQKKTIRKQEALSSNMWSFSCAPTAEGGKRN